MRATGVISLIGVATITAACATGAGGSFPADSTARPPTGAPARFALAAGAPTPAGGACLNPLRDPAANISLRLVRSSGGRGDYEVPDGQYGVGPNELLRIDCTRLEPLGIVRR